jgi:vancomycin resistance protein YoaR
LPTVAQAYRRYHAALAVRGSTAGQLRRRRRARARIGSTRLVVSAAGLALLVVAVGYAFAGSPSRLAPGTTIDGVAVGGMTTAQARSALAAKAASLASVPVTFVAGGRSWRFKPSELDVKADWRAAVAAAQHKGDGFSFVRGYRRLALRFFPLHLHAQAHAYDAAVAYEVDRVGSAIDRPAQDAKLTKHGLRVELLPGGPGRLLDRPAAARAIVGALAGFDRAPVALPVRTVHPHVTTAGLVPALHLDRRVLSAPVTLTFATRRWALSRWQLAAMLLLQQNGHSGLQLGGHAADAYFAGLVRAVSHRPRDAGFAVDGSRVRLVPALPGVGLDVPRTTRAVLAAAVRRTARTARLVVAEAQPHRSNAQAKAMGITGLVAGYETFYGGIANRIHNVELVAHLIDGKLIAPGTTFSFNQATGERTAAKGFLEAPVIINGELQTALGGGVCQVSTTVFNAAYEAGLPITARTNHALYISHYPLGRDATVDYPDVDLKFVNDTKHWLLLRTFVGTSSLVVSLYGSPQHRRVVTDTAPLTVVAPAPVQRSVDPTLKPGAQVIDSSGAPAQATSVRRRVYAPNGTLLYDNTWSSSYQAEPEVVRVGPKAKPKPKPPPVPTVTIPLAKLPQ